MTARNEVRELRATIEAITGRKPVSTSLLHLRRRLAMLRDESALQTAREVGAVAGHLMGSFVADLGVDRLAMLDRMARSSGAAPSAIVARAIDELAVRMGFGVAVERAKKGARQFKAIVDAARKLAEHWTAQDGVNATVIDEVVAAVNAFEGKATKT